LILAPSHELATGIGGYDKNEKKAASCSQLNEAVISGNCGFFSFDIIEFSW